MSERPLTRRTYTPDEIDRYAMDHRGQFEGQLWERCRCGAEPVYMPSHLCPQCIMHGADHPRISGPAAPWHTTEPAGAE